MCGNIHSESNALTLGNMKLLPEFISNAMNYPNTYQLMLWIIAETSHLILCL